MDQGQLLFGRRNYQRREIRPSSRQRLLVPYDDDSEYLRRGQALVPVDLDQLAGGIGHLAEQDRLIIPILDSEPLQHRFLSNRREDGPAQLHYQIGLGELLVFNLQTRRRQPAPGFVLISWTDQQGTTTQPNGSKQAVPWICGRERSLSVILTQLNQEYANHFSKKGWSRSEQPRNYSRDDFHRAWLETHGFQTAHAPSPITNL